MAEWFKHEESNDGRKVIFIRSVRRSDSWVPSTHALIEKETFWRSRQMVMQVIPPNVYTSGPALTDAAIIAQLEDAVSKMKTKRVKFEWTHQY